MLDGEKSSTNIDGVHFVPDLGGHAPKGPFDAFVGYPGVGAEDVDRAEVGAGDGDTFSDRVFIRYVTLDGEEIG